jgi:polyphosphate kinase 2 (PPK2 family)
MKTPVVTAFPGKSICLSKIDPDETGNLKKDKAVEKFVELRAQICELQEILYAEHERSLLLVFQAMDTAGKDGTVKALCNGLDPAGLLVHSFKVPSQEELEHDFLWRAHKVARPRASLACGTARTMRT